MYTSSPGGRSLQEYHWSGGFYSPKFLSYDKWGQSLPNDLYGFNSTNSEMIPKNTYYNKIQQYPIPVKNYELLNTVFPRERQLPSLKVNSKDAPSVIEDHIYPTSIANNQKINMIEPFRSTNSNKALLLTAIFLLVLYLFDKTFEDYIRKINIWLKITLIAILCFIVYTLVN